VKRPALMFALVLAACASKKSPPAESSVSFDANGSAVASKTAAADAESPTASFVRASGAMGITLYVAVPPDTTKRPFSIQITGFKGGTGAVHVANAVINRNDAENHEYQYVAKNDTFKFVITDFDVDDVPGTPMLEGTLSATFEGEMPYIYPAKAGNAFTEPLKITGGKLSNIKVSGAK
jgi:hypothetical protein